MTIEEIIAETRIELQKHPEKTYDILLFLYTQGKIDELNSLLRAWNEDKD